jgi:hypothetical protein
MAYLEHKGLQICCETKGSSNNGGLLLIVNGEYSAKLDLQVPYKVIERDYAIQLFFDHLLEDMQVDL